MFNLILKNIFYVLGKKIKFMKFDEAFIFVLYLSEGFIENNYILLLVVVCKDSMGLELLVLFFSVTVNNDFLFLFFIVFNVKNVIFI